jgi:putative Mg2+ transporter-C (MgtC) family protein
MTEVEGLIRIALAVMFGAAIGFDREAHSVSAGLRTHILVALGAATFTVLGLQIVNSPMFQSDNVTLDPSRIIQAAITGIGFLGGAIVFRDDDRARNVTTAAGIWAVTGVGIAVGLGYYVLATGVTLLVLSVLYLLKLLKRQAEDW